MIRPRRWSPTCWLPAAAVGVSTFLIGGAPLLLVCGGTWILAKFVLLSGRSETKAQAVGLAIVFWSFWLVGARYGIALVTSTFPRLIRLVVMTMPSLGAVLWILRNKPEEPTHVSALRRFSPSPIHLLLVGFLVLMTALKLLAGDTYRAIAMSGDSRNNALLSDTYLNDGSYLLRSRYPGFINVLMGYLTPFGKEQIPRPERMRQLMDVLPIAYFFGFLILGIGCILLSETISVRLAGSRHRSSQFALWFAPAFAFAPIFTYPILIDGFITIGVSAGLVAISLAFTFEHQRRALWMSSAAACLLLVGIFPPVVPPLVTVILCVGVIDSSRTTSSTKVSAARTGILVIALISIALAWHEVRSNLVLTGSIQRIPSVLIGFTILLALVMLLSRVRKHVFPVAVAFVLFSSLVWIEVRYIRSIAAVSPNGDAYYASKLILLLVGSCAALFLVPALVVDSLLSSRDPAVYRRIGIKVVVGLVAVAGLTALNVEARIPSAFPAIRHGWFRPRAETVPVLRTELMRDGRFIFWRFSRAETDPQAWDVAEDRIANFWSALTWSGPTADSWWAWDWAYGGISSLDPSELCGILERFSGVRVITRDHLLGGAIGTSCGPNDDTLVIVD